MQCIRAHEETTSITTSIPKEEAAVKSKKAAMYKESVESWNPFVGCRHGCVYCNSSFKRQMKRQKRQCLECYGFKPHFHAERLGRSLPRTHGHGFIFCCDMGDVAFCEPSWMQQVLTRIRRLPDKTFLIQSKNPNVFGNYRFPENVLLGTTIETNRDDLYEGISKAPLPSQRYTAMLKLQHPRKIVTVEPVLDFDVEVLERWIRRTRPEACYIGYDSKRNYLPEPELHKVKVLMKKLTETTSVRAKMIRKAWWEG
jgi:DNA repair photolyase